MPERKHTPGQPAELRMRGVRLFKENRSSCSSDTPEHRNPPSPETAEPPSSPQKKERTRFESQISLEVPA